MLGFPTVQHHVQVQSIYVVIMTFSHPDCHACEPY